MIHQIFNVLPIKYLVNQDGAPTTQHKLATGTKPSEYNLLVIFCPFVIQKDTAHIDEKESNMFHQHQKGFRDILFGIPQHQKGHLIYIPNTRKIVSSHAVVFEEKIYSVLAYTPHPYSDTLSMQPEVLYIPYGTPYYKQTGNIIAFAQFEEGYLLENEQN